MHELNAVRPVDHVKPVEDCLQRRQRRTIAAAMYFAAKESGGSKRR
jgi:hypothetical protein